MSFISAWLADYPFAPAIVFFVPAVLLFVFDVWDCNWGLSDQINRTLATALSFPPQHRRIAGSGC